MNEPKRILVVSMCTIHCLSAVQWGVSLAKKYGSKLFVVHIIHNPFGLEGWNLPLMRKDLEDEYEKMTNDAREAIDSYVKTESSKMPIEKAIIDGNPRDEILQFIGKEEIDLMIMVAHEQERIEHHIFGHDIHELVRRMPCSIFLVRRGLDYKRIVE